MGTLIRDLRYALRTLWRAPRFTALVVATLGIGIGANTAVFSVVDAVLLQRLPYAEPDRLVTVWRDETGRGGAARAWPSVQAWRDMRDEPGLFEAAAAWRPWEPTITGVDEPEVLRAAEISYDMFGRVLRVRPELGRDFLPADDVEGATPVVLLSHRVWRSRFGGDPDVVGRSVSLSDMPFTVIGVMPEGFRPPFEADAELWRPLGGAPAAECRGCADVGVLARLAQGVTPEQARAHGATLATRLAETFPDADRDVGLTIATLRSDVVRGSARPLRILLAAVGFVLLIACTNVANLLLARGLTRGHELAVRVALGAERGRIVALLLTESLVLAALGGAAGLCLAAWGTDALVALAPDGAVSHLAGVEMSGRVLAFTAAVTGVTGLLFGLVPARRVARGGGRRPQRGAPTPVRARLDAWGALAIGQLALALVLVGGAGLTIRSFRALDAIDLGFVPDGVLAADVSLPERRYPDEPDRRAYLQALLRRLGDLPGVRAVGAARSLPLEGDDAEVDVRAEDAPPPEGGTPSAWVRPVTEGYFEAIGLTLREGRGFEAADDAGGERVAVVNETLAHAFFPDGDAVGRRIAWADGAGAGWRTVVGVAADVRHFGLREPPRPAVYVPYRQDAPARMSVVVRVDGDPLALAADLRRAVSGLDPSIAPARLRPLRTLVDAALAPDRFAAILLSVFALLALVLAAVGVYGVVHHGVSWRTREVAVRVALGADAADVTRAVVGGALAMAAAGVAIGVAGSIAVGRLLADLLFGVRPVDAPTLAATAALMGAVALLAAWTPARRAGRADPVRGLRSE